MKACKYCKAESVVERGIMFTDFDGVASRTCWKGECQAKYHAELDHIEFRTRRTLQVAGKCIFKFPGAFCTKPSITGEVYCREHLTKRCHVCGAQAVRICPKKDWGDCNLPLCFAHNHVHKYYH